jgi:hypothetical protein
MKITHLPNGGTLYEYGNGKNIVFLKDWYLNGKIHRENGPAREYANGDKIWYLNGICHREDGPAIDFADGTKEWWLNNKHVSQKEFERLMRLKAFW